MQIAENRAACGGCWVWPRVWHGQISSKIAELPEKNARRISEVQPDLRARRATIIGLRTVKLSCTGPWLRRWHRRSTPILPPAAGFDMPLLSAAEALARRTQLCEQGYCVIPAVMPADLLRDMRAWTAEVPLPPPGGRTAIVPLRPCAAQLASCNRLVGHACFDNKNFWREFFLVV